MKSTKRYMLTLHFETDGGNTMAQAQDIDTDVAVAHDTDGTEYTDEIPNEQTIEAMREWSEMMANPNEYKRYKSFADVLRDVLGKQIDND